MRPQFHHIDAQSSITKTAVSRASLSKPTGQGSKPADQRPMAVAAAQRGKQSSDAQVSTMYEATDRFLDAAADENWTRCQYQDEEEPEAFALFEERLVLGDAAGKAKVLRSEWGAARYLDEINRPVVEEKKKKPQAPVRKGRAGGVRRVDGGAAGAGGSSRRGVNA